MKLVPITIEALSPLAFPERKPGVQFRTSLPYVPGAAIYGALGMLLGPHWQGSPDEFTALFRRIRCHNAYPVLEDDPWSRPLPMTAIQPKGGKTDGPRCPDRDGKPGKLRHPYADSLYARVCWERQQPPALIYAPADAEGRPWEAVGRTFYTLEDPQCAPWRPGDDLATAGIGTREVSQRVLTRVAINRRRGTAEDTRLYSPLVISEVMEDRDKAPVPTRFLGSIAVENEDGLILEALSDITQLGGRQTTGIGMVEIRQHSAASQEDSSADIEERVHIMSGRFRAQTELYTALGGTGWDFGAVFTINLLSDALLFEQGWLPTNELSATLLKELTGIEAQLVRSFTATTMVGGWNVSWQRPKQTAVATMMGSVFVFRTRGKLERADYQALARLEQDGIGERRPEGYGQVRICDEFHLLPLEEAQ